MAPVAPDLDVPDDCPRHARASCIANFLGSKGFCVLHTSHFVPDGVVSQARAEALEKAKPLVGDSPLERPSSLIAEGLLGSFGSARVAMVTPDEEAALGTNLQAMESCMPEIVVELQPEAWQFAGMLEGATPCLLHETGALTGTDIGLSLPEVEYWAQTFANHKLMCLHFLGPGRGSLELLPFGDEEAEAFDVATGPGITVLLRADLLLHRHRSMEASYAVGSFFMDPVKKRQVSELAHPTANELAGYLQTFLKDLKDSSKADSLTLHPSISREKQMAMNRASMQGDNVFIVGTSHKFSVLDDLQRMHGAYTAGIDAMGVVPTLRWDHEQYYDPDPQSWRTGRTFVQHVSMVEGLDLFDNKFFLISPAEAGQMDPQQRQVLECGYNCFHDGGLTKKQLMESDMGFLLATTAPEWMFSGTCKLGSGDLATIANRVAFCLGLKGTNLSVDVDHASPLVCVNLAQRELGHGTDNICVGGIYLNFTPEFWPMFVQGGWMNPLGRCCAFSDDGNGFGRADGIGNLFLKREASYKEEKTKKNLRDPHGILSGSKSRNQGQTASLTSPHGPCLQRILAETLYDSKISPLDVDAVECDAKGKLLDDCVETAAQLQVLRPYAEDNDEPLCQSSLKTLISNAWYAAAMGAMLKQLQAGKSGASPAIGHLRQLNPYLHEEAEGRTVQFSTELLENRGSTAIFGVMACGWGGTNAYIQLWVQKPELQNESTDPSQAASQQAVKQLAYWPGGRAKQKDEKEEEADYYIIGSWSGWMPELMEPEGNGVYSYTMTLGCLGWEAFKFCIGGDRGKVLHPGGRSPSACKIRGPVKEKYAGEWTIDGRSYAVEQWSVSSEGDESSTWVTCDGADTAPPGTKYRVTLVVTETGGYASWKMLKDEPVAASDESIKGKLYLVSTQVSSDQFSEKDFIPMKEDKSRADVWFAEVKLTKHSEKFVICRNRDWNQVFYPTNTVGSEGKALGPDDGYGTRRWDLRGLGGDTYRVELQWNRSAATASEEGSSVSWGILEPKSPAEVGEARLARTKEEIRKAAWHRIWAAKEKKKPRRKAGKPGATMDHVTLGSTEDGEEGIWTTGWGDHVFLGPDAGEGIE
mmetsp:Transcript_6301/g.9630  ORF Transcript_6301/g.9630 Transcript_6301/m.9630 type:complete len:1095 (-) Transcript_6301:94-3378(-)